MLPDTPSVSQLSQVITQAIAPAFLLGALAAFISVLILRMNRVVDRSQMLNAISSSDGAKAQLKADLPRLKQRSVLLNNAILFASVSAIFATLLVMLAFVSAFFNIQHERGVAALFIVTLGFFTAALINLARETRIALHEFDYYRRSRSINTAIVTIAVCRCALQLSRSAGLPVANTGHYDFGLIEAVTSEFSEPLR